MNGRTNHLLRSAAVVCCAQLGVGLAFGDSANSTVRLLAATCAACHGTDGRAVAGPPVMRLAGMPRSDFVRQMRAFRDETPEATVMRQIAKGYGDEQISALGDFFAAQH